MAVKETSPSVVWRFAIWRKSKHCKWEARCDMKMRLSVWAFLSLQFAPARCSVWQKATWLLTNYFCLFPMIAPSFAKDTSPSGFCGILPEVRGP